MARPKSEEDKPLTDTELQIMRILWALEEANVHEVLDSLTEAQGKNYAYTTVSTLLRVLEKKGAVKSKKQGRGHFYSPLIDREKYQHKATDHLVKNVFEGERATLIQNLLGQSQLSEQELKEIRNLINQKAKK